MLRATHVLNRVPTKNKEVTPFKEWEKKKLNLSYLHTWGCLAKVNVPIIKKHKLGPKTVDCVFLGYAIHSIGYISLLIKYGVPDMRVGSIMESRDATFFESEFPMNGNAPSTSAYESVISPDTFVHIEQTTIEDPEEDDSGVTRKSKR